MRWKNCNRVSSFDYMVDSLLAFMLLPNTVSESYGNLINQYN